MTFAGGRRWHDGHMERNPLPSGWTLALMLAVLAAVEASLAPDVSGPRWLVASISALAMLLLAARQTHPVAVVVTMSAIITASTLALGASLVAVPVLGLAVGVFAAGRYGSLPRSLVAPVTAVAAILTHLTVDPTTSITEGWMWALNSIWVFGLGLWFRQQEDLMAAERAASSERADASAARERLAVARDLHDVLSHSLTVMVVQSEAAGALVATRPDRAASAIDAVGRTGRAALAELREVLPSLGTSPSPMRGLPVELEQLVSRFHPTGLDVDLEVSGDLAGLDPDTARLTALLVRECLTNVLRHSSASRATVHVGREGGLLTIRVADPGPASGRWREGAGHGIAGMRHRVAELGGTMESGPLDRGFQVLARLPVGSIA